MARSMVVFCSRIVSGLGIRTAGVVSVGWACEAVGVRSPLGVISVGTLAMPLALELWFCHGGGCLGPIGSGGCSRTHWKDQFDGGIKSSTILVTASALPREALERYDDVPDGTAVRDVWYIGRYQI